MTKTKRDSSALTKNNDPYITYARHDKKKKTLRQKKAEMKEKATIRKEQARMRYNNKFNKTQWKDMPSWAVCGVAPGIKYSWSADSAKNFIPSCKRF